MKKNDSTRQPEATQKLPADGAQPVFRIIPGGKGVKPEEVKKSKRPLVSMLDALADSIEKDVENLLGL